ncbi:MAG TPA: ElyC/SanA/YdcF family protein [Erysipelothrix sp.]
MDYSITKFMLGFTLVYMLVSVFVIIYKRKSLLSGFLFNNLIVLLGLDFMVIVFTHDIAALRIIAFALGIIFVIFMLLGLEILLIALFWNARIVRKKEGDSFANRLTFFAALGLIFTFVGLPVLKNILPDHWHLFNVIFSYYLFVVFYFAWMFLNFLSSVFLFQMIPPKKDKDFIIVLGSGLRNGKEVTPLLASRIQGALNFYHKQKEKGKEAKLIFSGGQGADELIPEGVAMRDYALSQGIIAADAIAEDRSTTTEENLRFSKAIMDDLAQGQDYKCVVVSNNYHVFRAAHFAEKVGLDAQGIGTPTAKYFLPNALIREFVGLIVMKPKFHKRVLILGLIFIILLTILNVVMQPYIIN